jgi:transitional endoplasmic reticulum ATPase
MQLLGPSRSTLGYLHNVLSRLPASLALDEAASDWLDDFVEILGDANHGRPRNRDRAILGRRALMERLESMQLLERHRDDLGCNIDVLSDFLGLQSLDRGLLELLVRRTLQRDCEELTDALIRVKIFPGIDVVAAALNTNRHDLQRVVAHGGVLSKSGLVSQNPSSGFPYDMNLTYCLGEALNGPPQSIEQILDRILGSPSTAKLCLSDFPHLEQPLEFIRKVLEGALTTRENGVHILLYGPPGTGKTELAKTLGNCIGASVYPVGERIDGGEPSRRNRIELLQFAQNALSGRTRTLLLFDEMEDLLAAEPGQFRDLYGVRRPEKGSRVFLHRMLEDNPVPVIWTCNDLSSFDAAFLRRFTFALEVGLPPTHVREKLWINLASSHGLDLDPREGQQLARDFRFPPSMVERAVRATRLAGHPAAKIGYAIEGLGLNAPRRSASGRADFLPELANTDHDLGQLVEMLKRVGRTHPSPILLSGPPGTGKTEFAAHLANRLDMELMVKRPSDILGSFVGETERQVARSFREATAEGGLLFFDEIDSLLFGRENAHRTWEISLVNEMLTWLEECELPVLCATNRAESLDSAALNRFLFHVRFDYMTPAQARNAFRHYTGQEAPTALDSVGPLVARDFAVALRKAALRGIQDPEAITALLAGQAGARAPRSGPIGFHSTISRMSPTFKGAA